MPIQVPQNSGSKNKFEAGQYRATCTGMVVMGTSPKESTFRKNPQMAVFFDVPELAWEMEKDGVTTKYRKVILWLGTLSTGDGSFLRKMLGAWRGEEVTTDEMTGKGKFDPEQGGEGAMEIDKMIGATANLMLIEKGGYPRIEGVTMPDRGTPKREADHLTGGPYENPKTGDKFDGLPSERIYWNVLEGHPIDDLEAMMPKWFQFVVKAARDCEERNPPSQADTPKQPAPETTAGTTDDDEDMPF